jgi:hypothetical protein
MAIIKPAVVFAKVKQNGIGTTGDAIELATSATGYVDFIDVYSNGDRVPYWLEYGSAWECGIGSLTTGTPHQIERSCVIDSSVSGNALVTVGDNNACVLSVGPSPLDASFQGVFATATGYSVTGDTSPHRLGFTVSSDPWAAWDGTSTGGGNCFFQQPCWAAIQEYRIDLQFTAVGASYVQATIEKDSAVADTIVTVTGAATGTSIVGNSRLLTTDDLFLRVLLETDATGGLTAGASMKISWHA